MSTRLDSATRAVFAWFGEPSPADPARLAGMIGLIYEPEVITDPDRLDLLAVGAVVRDDQGLVLEVVSRDDDGNLWYQTGDADALVTAAITLPATLIHDPQNDA
ncbi:hypothetical protein [Sinomonas soli]